MTPSLRMASIISLAFFLFSCSRPNDGMVRGHKAVSALLDSVETIMDDDAPYADSLVQLIDPQSIKGKKLRARYALLYTAAQYKDFQPFTSDSLIMEAVRYYSIGKNLDYRFLSYYYLGCVLYELNQMHDASIALAQAEQLLDTINNDFWRGLLYKKLGDIYRRTYDFSRSDEYYTKAITFYERAGKEEHALYALFFIGENRFYSTDYIEADSIFTIVQEGSISGGYSSLYLNCIYDRMYCAVYRKDVDKAIRLHNDLEQTRNSKIESNNYKGLMAIYYHLLKNYEKSESYVESLWKENLTEPDSTYLYYVGYKLAESKGDKDEAISLLNQIHSNEKKRLRGIINHPIDGVQRDYYKTLSELESLKAHKRNAALILSIIISSLIISFLIFIVFNHRRKTNLEIADYLSTIADLTDSEFQNKNQIETLNSQLRDMLRKQFSASDFLYTRYYEQIDDNKKAERLYRVVRSQVEGFTNRKNIEHIDELLNETFDGIMSKVLSSGIDIKEKDLLLLRFVLAGFSSKSIAALLGETHLNVNQRKKRLLDKIQIKDPNLMDELSIALNNR